MGQAVHILKWKSPTQTWPNYDAPSLVGLLTPLPDITGVV